MDVSDRLRSFVNVASGCDSLENACDWYDVRTSDDLLERIADDIDATCLPMPKFEDGGTVHVGDSFLSVYGDEDAVRKIEVDTTGRWKIYGENYSWMVGNRTSMAKRCGNRHTDADGKDIHIGDLVYSTLSEGPELTVVEFVDLTPDLHDVMVELPDGSVHKASCSNLTKDVPMFSADGVRITKRSLVYDLSGTRFMVTCVESDCIKMQKLDDISFPISSKPSDLYCSEDIARRALVQKVKDAVIPCALCRFYWDYGYCENPSVAKDDNNVRKRNPWDFCSNAELKDAGCIRNLIEGHDDGEDE